MSDTEEIIIRWMSPEEEAVVAQSPSNIGTYLAKDSQGITLPSDTTILGDLTVEGEINHRPSDWINVKDYGAVLDGVTDDSAAFQAAYTAAPTYASINVPHGGYNVETALTPRSDGSVLWKLDGNCLGTGFSQPIDYIGDGDVTETYDGRVHFSKQLINSPNGYAVVEIDLNNNCPIFPGPDTINGLLVSATAGPIGSGQTWAINTILNTNSTVGTSNVGIASSVFRAGSGSAWQFFGQTIDATGLPTRTIAADVAVELDLSVNGPEVFTSAWDPGGGGRSFIEIDAFQFEPPAWQAGHDYAVGNAIQPTASNGFTYVCTVAGTSGSAEPTWPLDVGTVTDGGVTWAFGTTKAAQISRAIGVGIIPGANVQFGAGLFFGAPFYDAILELSSSTLVDGGVKNAAIRIAADQPIDFTGDLTDAGQNLHTLRYVSSGTPRLSYKVGSTDRFVIPDTAPTVSGSRASGAALTSLLGVLASLGLIIDGTTS